MVELDVAAMPMALATLKRKREEATSADLPAVAPPTTLLPPAGVAPQVSVTPAPMPVATGSPTPRSEDDLHAVLKRLFNRMTSTHKVIGHEYHVVPGQSQFGVGDFLLEKVGEYTLVVVEVKYIDLASTGHTARVSRTKHRKKVKEQAWRYARHARDKYPGYATAVCVYTNEIGMKKLGEVEPICS